VSNWLAAFEQQVQTAAPDDFWFWSAGILAAALFGWWLAFGAFRRARLIEDIPTSKIRSAAQGYVELIGHAEFMDGPDIISPLSGRRCLWYRYRIEERRRSGKHHRWHQIEKGISDSFFLLKDDTAYCVIDPEGAEVRGGGKHCWYGSSRWPEKRATNAKASTGFWKFIGLGFGRYRYTEWWLDEYDPLYAIGRFRTVGGANNLTPINDDVRELVAKWKHDPETLKKFDTNRDGKIDVGEWETLRKAAHQEAVRTRLEAPETPAVNVLQKPEFRQQLFLLSTDDPDKMAFGFRWKGRGLLLFAIIAAAMTAYAIQLRIG
jgi:hypothetical protein